MTEPLDRPKRKDPLKRTRLPAAAAGGAQPRRARADRRPPRKGASCCRPARIAARCIYPPRDACPGCFAPMPPFCDVRDGGALIAVTTVRHRPTSISASAAVAHRLGGDWIAAHPSSPICTAMCARAIA